MPDRLATVIQVTLLIGLLVACHVLLVGQLLHERADQLGQERRVLGQDFGIRVLLRNRAESGEPSTGYQRLRVNVLQACLLYSPEAPGNPDYRLLLNPGDDLHIEPHPTEGLRLSTVEGEWEWPVTLARLQPVTHTTVPSAGGSANDELIDPRLFEAADRKPTVTVGQYRYRGSLDLLRAGPAEVQAINILPMESYLGGVVSVEMSPSYPIEALKSQAVAARSYAYAKVLMNDSKRAWDVSDTVQDQEYRGESATGTKVQWAITETRGLILTVGGVAFTPFFCASSGGYTASVDDVFTGARAADGVTPLSAVMPAKEDPFCLPGAQQLHKTGSHWRTFTSVDPASLRRILKTMVEREKINKEASWINDIEVLQQEHGRVNELAIRTALDDFQMSGHEFRMLIGPRQLRSTRWSPDSPRRPDGSRDTYEITCFGYGHGVGMSQISAYAMAGQNFPMREILGFFYPGATIVQRW